MTQPSIRFTTLDDRKRRDDLKPANDTLSALMEKTVGLDAKDQAGWLLYHLKRLYSKGTHLAVVMEDYKPLHDFSSASTSLRKNYSQSQYKVFQKAITKMSGSNSMDTHKRFLNEKYSALHRGKARFQPLIENS